MGKWGEGGGEVVVVVVMGKADELEKGRRGLCNNAIERPEMQAKKNFLVKEDNALTDPSQIRSESDPHQAEKNFLVKEDWMGV